MECWESKCVGDINFVGFQEFLIAEQVIGKNENRSTQKVCEEMEREREKEKKRKKHVVCVCVSVVTFRRRSKSDA